jgi:hypothetical protein
VKDQILQVPADFNPSVFAIIAATLVTGDQRRAAPSSTSAIFYARG